MKKNLRGWFIVFAGLLVMGIVYGGVINCNTLFVVPVSTELGIPRQSFSLTLTIMFLCYMVSSFMSSKMFQKFGLKTCMTIGSILVPLFFFLNGMAPNLVCLYLSSACIGLVLPFISFTTFSVVIKDYFEENSGFAIGISFMGSGIGGMFWSFLAGSWLNSLGYHMTYRLMAMVMAVIAIPVVFFLVKPNHENFGVVAGEKLSMGAALKEKNAIVIVLLSFLVGITPVIISQSLVPNALDKGYPMAYGSLLNAGFMAGLCIMKLVIGRLFDKAGLKFSLILALVAGEIALFCCLLVNLQFLHPIYIVALAFNGTIQSMAPSLIAMNYSRKEMFASANGLAVGVNYLGCAMAPFLLNAFFDALGSYDVILLIDVFMTFATILCVVFAPKIRKA